MRDILDTLSQWHSTGETIALATVIQTWGSSPRQPGAKMALTPSGHICGSVSGGCVEGAVYEEGVAALKHNTPKLLHFGVADETAWEVGLACGGSIEVFVQPFAPAFLEAVQHAFTREEPFAIATCLTGDLIGAVAVWRGTTSLYSSDTLPADAASLIQNQLANGTSRRVTLSTTTEMFIEVILPPPTLVVVGGVHITVALVRFAQTLGYRTIVVDPRKAFGNEARFPHVDQLLAMWPDEAFQQLTLTNNTAVAMLTHDPKLDDPALMVALTSDAFYVGALGSKTTQAKRRERLLEAGLTPAQLQRLFGPIGLDLGGKSPEEVALAIMAQIVAARNGVTSVTSKNR